MAKKAKPVEELAQPEVVQPESLPMEGQPAPVSLVDEDTEEMPAPVSLVEQPAPVQLAPEGGPVVEKTAEANHPAGQPEQKPGLLRLLFDPATPRGRFMRSFARWAGIIILMFAIGFLVVYMTLYQPVAQQLEASREESASLMAQLKTAQDELVEVKGDLSDTTAALLQSENLNAENEAELAQMNLRSQTLEALYLVTEARLVWMSNNQALTLSTLVKAQTIFTAIQPEIEARNSDLAKLVVEQLDAAMADIVKNAPSTPSSLEKLYRTVNSLQELFTEPVQ